MSVTLTGTGGCWTRLGKFTKEINRTVSGFSTPLDSGVEAITDQFVDADWESVDGLQTSKTAYRSVHATYLTDLANFAGAAVIAQVNRDVPLQTATVVNALSVLDKQMRASSDSIQRPTTSVSVTAGSSNLSDTVVKASLTNARGEPLDMVFAEDITLTVTSDAGNGGTAWSETVTVLGEAAAATTDHNWPLGSGANTSFTVTDPDTDDLVTDGGFELWGGTGNNTPTEWLIKTGAAGTHVFRESTNVLRDNYAAKLTSDGSTLVTLREAVTLSPNTVYGVCVFVKASATDSSGIFRIRLTDGNGSAISNDKSVSLSTTADMNATISTASFTTVSAFFSTPRQLPDTVYLEFGYSVSPSSGKSLYVDGLGFAAATQAYAGGPFLFACSRAAKSAQEDTWTVAVSTNAGTNTFVRSLDRMFALRENGIYVVSASSPTVADSLAQ